MSIVCQVLCGEMARSGEQTDFSAHRLEGDADM